MAKKKVLIVDDEQDIRTLLRRILGNEFTILEAPDGAEAIKMAHSQKPDIILMDIMMPNVDGYTACHDIKFDKATMSIPIIMVTALGFDLNVKLSQTMGADGYITKPFNQKNLLDTVNKFLRVIPTPGQAGNQDYPGEQQKQAKNRWQ